jgi:hypothetical protein
MPTIQELRTTIKSLEKRKSFAFAMYFAECNKSHTDYIELYEKHKKLCEQLSGVEGIPAHIVNELKEQYEKDKKKIECPVCLDVISVRDLTFSSCGHKYCSACLNRLFEQPQPKCALCRKKIFRKSQVNY